MVWSPPCADLPRPVAGWSCQVTPSAHQCNRGANSTTSLGLTQSYRRRSSGLCEGAAPRPSQTVHRMIVRASREKQKKNEVSFADQLLDYIEAGPKMRRWYGASEQGPRDGQLLPQEEEAEEEEEEEEEEEGNGAGTSDGVLISDGDNETGSMIILALILKRKKIKALVKDTSVASASFGPYVEYFVEDDTTKSKSMTRALRGVGTVILTGKVGSLSEIQTKQKVKHLILLSQVGVSQQAPSLFSFLGGGNLDQAKANEAAVVSSGIPCTIIRTGQVKDDPSGMGIFIGEGDELRGSLSREDVAALCLAALEAGPPSSSPRVFEAENSGTGILEDEELISRIRAIGVAQVA